MARRPENDDRLLEQLRRERSVIEGRYIAFQHELETAYGALAGQPAGLAEVQDALPAGAALIGWVDVQSRGKAGSVHWACLVRRDGEPVWMEIPGSGADRVWTEADDSLLRALRDALKKPAQPWRESAAAIAAQRLGPLKTHLQGVKRLVVLPSAGLKGIPVETLLTAWPQAPKGIIVSYAPSGTMHAFLTRHHRDRADAPRLLALGDPAFPAPEREMPAPPPPTNGIALLNVDPTGRAGLAGLRKGDVLLEYDGTPLRSAEDLNFVGAEVGARSIPVKFWRDGEIRSSTVAAGQLGIEIHPRKKAAEILLTKRASREVHRLVRGEALDLLPGSRREVELISGMFPAGQVTTLLGGQATEPNLQELARSGKLRKFQFIHLATHGKSNPSVALSSALFLAPEKDRSDDSTALETDGRITAEQIVQTWDLDADLVVLSACETGLGRYAGGEGYLGFTQALFVKGARSVVLSMWKVPDHATSLLMNRFYANLLARREGRSKPLPKAEALDEAKGWLRNLTAEQAEDEMKRLKITPAVVTRSERPVARLTAEPTRPFEHPYNWAGFVLIGDPR
jgi:hypothetical protein